MRCSASFRICCFPIGFYSKILRFVSRARGTFCVYLIFFFFLTVGHRLNKSRRSGGRVNCLIITNAVVFVSGVRCPVTGRISGEFAVFLRDICGGGGGGGGGGGMSISRGPRNNRSAFPRRYRILKLETPHGTVFRPDPLIRKRISFVFGGATKENKSARGKAPSPLAAPSPPRIPTTFSSASPTRRPPAGCGIVDNPFSAGSRLGGDKSTGTNEIAIR